MVRSGWSAALVLVFVLVSSTARAAPSVSELVEKCEVGTLKDCRRAEAAVADDYDHELVDRIAARQCTLGDPEGCMLVDDQVRACELRDPTGCHNLAARHADPSAVLQVLLRGCVKARGGGRAAGAVCAEGGEEARRQGALGAAAYFFDQACKRRDADGCRAVTELKKQRVKLKKVREERWSVVVARLAADDAAGATASADAGGEATTAAVAAPATDAAPHSIEVAVTVNRCSGPAGRELEQAIEDTLRRPTGGSAVRLTVELGCIADRETEERYENGVARQYTTVTTRIRAVVRGPGLDPAVEIATEGGSTFAGLGRSSDGGISVEDEDRFRGELAERRDEIWRAVDRT